MAWVHQRDGVTCGPSVAVMAGALLDAEYGAPLQAERAQQWFNAEQGRVHQAVNMVWPRALGTTPAGMARAINARSANRGVRYRWRPPRRADALTDVCAALAVGWPVAMLIGSAIPRHWVLLTQVDGLADSPAAGQAAGSADNPALRCYDPATGRLHTIAADAVRQARLEVLGFPRAFAFVLPV